jgi:predicted ATPase
VGGSGSGKSTLLEAIAVASYPDARTFLLDRDEIRPVAYEETEHFKVTRDFLNGHQRTAGTPTRGELTPPRA